MSFNRTSLAVIVAFAILNLVVLTINLAIQAKANVGGMDTAALYHDRDFRSAVQNVVRSCRVKDTRISC
jgi:hypothetical protein